MAIAAAMFPESRGARLSRLQNEPDQWTINNRFSATGALHRVALGDAAGTEVYVAEATGEIVKKTDRSSRFWGYAGPVMHWFYFTPLRAQRAPLWNDLIVYGSVVGCVLCVLGIVIGVYRFSMSRRFMRGTSMTPYVGWLQWHHYAGLLFGVIHIHLDVQRAADDDAVESVSQRRADAGSGSRDSGRRRRPRPVQRLPPSALAEFQKRFQPKELELLQFMGTPFYAAYERAGRFSLARTRTPRAMRRRSSARHACSFRPAAARREYGEGFTQDELLTAARAAMTGMEPVEVTWLTDVDAYYYDRTGGRHLPALRAKFDDPDETWLYLDSMDGSLVQARSPRQPHRALAVSGSAQPGFPVAVSDPLGCGIR